MDKNKVFKIVFTAGGTGGHIFPVVAIIRELKEIWPDNNFRLYYIGPRDEIIDKYIRKEGVIMKYIYAGKIRRYIDPKSIIQNFIDIFFKMPIGIVQSFFYLFIIAPDLVFGKGGYGSFPVIINTAIFSAPVMLHESDAIAGIVNQKLQGLASKVFVSFPGTVGIEPSKVTVVGNPIRKEIIQGDFKEAQKIFNLEGKKKIILVLGGSQGSERVNDVFLSISTKILREFEIIHQCGSSNYKQVLAEIDALITDHDDRKRYHVYPFFDEHQMKNAYKCADLIVSRAGSGNIFEIAANKKASILLPLSESAQGHQIKNAYAYGSTGATIVLEEENLTAQFFLGKINELFYPYEQIKTMEERAGNFSRLHASKIIAHYIKDYLTL